MGLTGRGFLGVLSLWCVVLFGVTVALMPRLAGGWTRVLARVGLQLLLNSSILLLAAVILNNQFGFYASWTDLFGDGSLTATTSSRGSTVRTALTAMPVGPGFAAFPAPRHALPALPQPGARQQIYQVTGPKSHLEGQIRVYLPASYQEASAARRTYPVIIGLHGYPTQPLLWFTGMHVDQHIDAAVAMHRMGEAIVVVPQSNIPLATDTECVDGNAGGPQMETWLAKDLPAWIVDHFRVRRNRTSWAVAGYSAGGWCSAMIAMRHPDVFGAGIVMSGYFRPDFTNAYRPYRPSDAGWQRCDLVAMAAHEPPPLALWIQSGQPNRFDTVLHQFLAAVRPPTSVTLMEQPNAGHRIDVWSADLPTALEWLGAKLPGFAPAGQPAARQTPAPTGPSRARPGAPARRAVARRPAVARA